MTHSYSTSCTGTNLEFVAMRIVLTYWQIM